MLGDGRIAEVYGEILEILRRAGHHDIRAHLVADEIEWRSEQDLRLSS
jgi:hypothetical protein